MRTVPEELLREALSWHDDGHKVALATVVRTWGSSPRRPGSLLVIRDDGHFIGSVSGGCVEGAVVRAAAEVVATGDPQRLTFGVSNEQAMEVGLACGGTLEVFVERLS